MWPGLSGPFGRHVDRYTMLVVFGCRGFRARGFVERENSTVFQRFRFLPGNSANWLAGTCQRDECEHEQEQS
ncbi:hypothetical protein VTN31DRAFT_5328 [Thermomyces dupontii]|uniref:uncharacterized protein n=1 Tax=Talaromyces thermophilus TaxID=28565 RepID=UPI003742ECFB